MLYFSTNADMINVLLCKDARDIALSNHVSFIGISCTAELWFPFQTICLGVRIPLSGGSNPLVWGFESSIY